MRDGRECSRQSWGVTLAQILTGTGPAVTLHSLPFNYLVTSLSFVTGGGGRAEEKAPCSVWCFWGNVRAPWSGLVSSPDTSDASAEVFQIAPVPIYIFILK